MKNLKKFNINDYIYIQIEENGWIHLKNTVGEEYIKKYISPYKNIIDDKTWYHLQCWVVFELFPVKLGTSLFNTNIMLDKDYLT